MVWRGIVYAILMTLGKVLVGAVILGVDAVAAPAVAVDVAASSKRNVTSTPLSTAAERRLEDERPEDMLVPSTRRAMFVKESLPAAGFLGVALVARGEIGVTLKAQGCLRTEADHLRPSRCWSFKSPTIHRARRRLRNRGCSAQKRISSHYGLLPCVPSSALLPSPRSLTSSAPGSTEDDGARRLHVNSNS